MAARHGLAISAASIACLAASLAAQEPVFRASVETVTVDVAVTRGGTPVTGLEARHFTIRDNGVPQTVERVMYEAVPLQLVLVFDTSSSLGLEGLRVLTDAAGALIDAVAPGDRVGVVTFSEDVAVRVLPTVAHERVRGALRGIAPGGPTAWRDALFVATQLFETRRDTRRVVLLLTDGRDTSSWLPADEVDDVVRRSGVVVHAVEQPAPLPPVDPRETFSRTGAVTVTTPSALRAVIEAGGGRLWAAAPGAGLRERFLDVLNELRSRYLVSYVPAGPAAPGWHDVTVGLVDVRGEVRSRPGYFVPPSR